MRRYGVFLLFTFFALFHAFSETLEIRCEQPVLVYNNHVGNEWVFDMEIDGRRCPIGRTVQVKCSGIIKVVFTAQEVDKISDFGSGTIDIDINTLEFNTEESAGIEAIVTENRGRYRGNKAKWKIWVYFSRLGEREVYED